MIDYIVAGIVVLLIALTFRRYYKRKKSGISGCTGCSGCSSYSECNLKEKKKNDEEKRV